MCNYYSAHERSFIIFRNFVTHANPIRIRKKFPNKRSDAIQDNNPNSPPKMLIHCQVELTYRSSCFELGSYRTSATNPE